MTTNNSKESWHLSKSVPVTLILALVLQAGAIVWTVGQMNADIESNVQDIRELKSDVKVLENSSHTVDVRLGRIEENLKAISTGINRIERGLVGK